MFKNLAKYFLQGLFYLIPISVTIYAIFFLVVEIDSLIDLKVPGLGILILLIVITIVGFVGTNFINYFRPFERIIEKTPLIKIIYTSMKDMMNAFVGKKKQFRNPVLVKSGNNYEAERLGFITKNNLEELNIKEDKVAVYLPFSYAISGEVLIVPRKNITPLKASSADVMKMIISGGVTQVENHEKK